MFLKLLREGKNPYYYTTKSGHEIDFYLKSEKFFIEVTLDYDKEHVKKVIKVMEETKVKKSLIIT